MNDFENNNSSEILQQAEQEATYDEYIEARNHEG